MFLVNRIESHSPKECGLRAFGASIFTEWFSPFHNDETSVEPNRFSSRFAAATRQNVVVKGSCVDGIELQLILPARSYYHRRNDSTNSSKETRIAFCSLMSTLTSIYRIYLSEHTLDSFSAMLLDCIVSGAFLLMLYHPALPETEPQSASHSSLVTAMHSNAMIIIRTHTIQ